MNPANNQALSPCSTGLVYYSTSEKPSVSKAGRLLASKPLLVDAVLNRLKRLKTSVITSARLIQNQNKRGFRYKAAMCTLTYKPGESWHRRDIASVLDHMRKYCKRNWKGHAFQYTWCAELQERGAVHYHIILWLPYIGGRPRKLPKPDDQGWWHKGMTEIKWARNAVGYIAKYASKGGLDESGNTFPRGTRLYGTGGLSGQSKREYRYYRVPTSVRLHVNPGGDKSPDSFDLRRIMGGYFNRDNGEFIAGLYAFCLLNGKPHIVKKTDLSTVH